MFPLMNATGPSLSLQKQAHTITGTPPWSSLLQIFLRANFSHLFWRQKIHNFRGSLSCLTRHSSDHAISAQSSRVQCWCALAHLRRLAARSLVNNILSTALHFQIPSSNDRRWRIHVEISWNALIESSLTGTLVSDSAITNVASAEFLWSSRVREIVRCFTLIKAGKKTVYRCREIFKSRAILDGDENLRPSTISPL